MVVDADVAFIFISVVIVIFIVAVNVITIIMIISVAFIIYDISTYAFICINIPINANVYICMIIYASKNMHSYKLFKYPFLTQREVF